MSCRSRKQIFSPIIFRSFTRTLLCGRKENLIIWSLASTRYFYNNNRATLHATFLSTHYAGNNNLELAFPISKVTQYPVHLLRSNWSHRAIPLRELHRNFSPGYFRDNIARTWLNLWSTHYVTKLMKKCSQVKSSRVETPLESRSGHSVLKPFSLPVKGTFNNAFLSCDRRELSCRRIPLYSISSYRKLDMRICSRKSLVEAVPVNRE